MSDTLELTRQLISRQSVTPDDGGCQEILISRLEKIGFKIQRLPYGEVTNFWARFGDAKPLIVFAGHTDVVPTGPVKEWQSQPFSPQERNGCLYGRGAADMKGSLAAMITACEAFLGQAQPKGSIGFLITSDEEGPALNGTVRVVDWLQANKISMDYCIVGEPSSDKKLGDTIKIGRRGSLNGTLIIHGIQGHIAYPQLADNPIHKALLPLAELSNTTWDKGNSSFPPTSFQISNIQSGTGATNVIPDSIQVTFNFRFSNELTDTMIREKCATILEKYNLEYSLSWSLSGNPFITPEGEFADNVSQCIQEVLGVTPEFSTSGGTSDGRFIAPAGPQLLELGPCNASIHKVDEHINIQDLENLSRVYLSVLQRVLL